MGRYRRYHNWEDDDDDWEDDDDWDEDDDDQDEDDDDDWDEDIGYNDLDPEFLGIYGEDLTEEELEKLTQLNKSGKILRNVYIPKYDGTTTEIDLLFITSKGIFVIESKNYSGWIWGNEKDKKWTATFPNGIRRQFYNPVKQNENHIKWLKRYLGFNCPCYSLIVFSERCELKKITVKATGVGVVKRDSLVALLNKVWNRFPDHFNDVGIESLFMQLHPCVCVDAETKERHAERFEEK